MLMARIIDETLVRVQILLMLMQTAMQLTKIHLYQMLVHQYDPHARHHLSSPQSLCVEITMGTNPPDQASTEQQLSKAPHKSIAIILHRNECLESPATILLCVISEISFVRCRG